MGRQLSLEKIIGENDFCKRMTTIFFRGIIDLSVKMYWEDITRKLQGILMRGTFKGYRGGNKYGKRKCISNW